MVGEVGLVLCDDDDDDGDDDDSSLALWVFPCCVEVGIG